MTHTAMEKRRHLFAILVLLLMTTTPLLLMADQPLNSLEPPTLVAPPPAATEDNNNNNNNNDNNNDNNNYNNNNDNNNYNNYNNNNDGGGGGVGVGVDGAKIWKAKMEEDNNCVMPMPFHLKQPHTHFSYIPLDTSHHRTLGASSIHPLKDDEWYRQKVLLQQVMMGTKEESGTHKKKRVLSDWEQPLTWDTMRSQIKTITIKQLNSFIQAAYEKQKETTALNTMLDAMSVMVDAKSPAAYKNKFNKPTNMSKVSALSNQGNLETHTVIIAKTTLDIDQSTDLLAPSVDPKEICKDVQEMMSPPTCDPKAKYRTIDGTCNNLDNPLWGAAFTAFRRNTPHNYGDNVKELRQAKDGQPLPSPRWVSTEFALPENPQSSCFTILHMTFGQFVDHDLTATPHVTGKDGNDITCCDRRVLDNPSLLHPECAPIQIPKDDPLYAAYNITCMEFVRSAQAPTCSVGKREQLNQITSYLDGSAVYGSEDEAAKALRKMKEGLLAMQVTRENQELLPANTDRMESCNVDEHMQNNHFCFNAGDHRANEQILLTLMQTLFARYHNSIARQLGKLNPSWDDERLYQEARRIVVAVLQYITYREFLQGVLGTATMKSLNLLPQENGRYTHDYNNTLNAAIANEFAAAAYRFGHSMIPTRFLMEARDNTYTSENLNSMLFSPFGLYSSEMMGNLARGASKQRAHQVDSSFTREIVGKLFQRNLTVGLDLIALNIQRGRDHGLGSYVASRKACGFGEARDFNDLAKSIHPNILNRLRAVYKHVSDIDLFVGMLAERPLNGAQVGATLACILGDQFLRLKKGDRFWFENKSGPGAFTTEQLREIHKVSLARVLCDTVLEMRSIQRWPLNLESPYNPEMPCDSQCIPSLDISHWKE